MHGKSPVFVWAPVAMRKGPWAVFQARFDQRRSQLKKGKPQMCYALTSNSVRLLHLRWLPQGATSARSLAQQWRLDVGHEQKCPETKRF